MVLVLLCVSLSRAEAPATQPAPSTVPSTQPRTTTSDDHLSVTEHQAEIGNAQLHYRATAGTLAVKGEDGKKKADIFFVAYEKSDVPDLSKRPITFVFNGGPGAAAVWLHLGTAGPVRIVLPDDGTPPPPPYATAVNQETWLTSTDLVFVDPVATGYSRASADQDRNQFFGTEADIRFLGEFIRLYLSRWERWPSPLYLAGESYGTTRVAGLSDHLLDRHGIAVNGVVLISSVLDFQTISLGEGNDLPYALYLPSFAAIAHYHKKLAPDLQDDLARTLAQVEKFASDEYLPALLKGRVLSPERRAAIVETLSRYTGLPADIIDRGDLRISPEYFRKNLLDRGRTTVGRFDARLKGFEPDALSSSPQTDPSFHAIYPVYAGAFNAYVRQQLKFDSDLPYEILTNKVWPWDFGSNGQGFTRTADELGASLVKNPHLRIMFASGYYDLATPYFATNWTIDHLKLPDALRARISHMYYPGGHMMYHEAGSRAKLQKDIAAFFASPAR